MEKIKIEEVNFFNRFVGYKVYINGVKYPKIGICYNAGPNEAIEMAKNVFAYLWNPQYINEAMPDFVVAIGQNQIRSSLKKYIYKQLNIAC